MIVTFDSEMFKNVEIDERATTSTAVSFRVSVKEIARSAWTKEKRSGVAVVVVSVRLVCVSVRLVCVSVVECNVVELVSDDDPVVE